MNIPDKMRNDYTEAVTLKREARTSDNAGGKLVSFSTEITFEATKHFYSSQSLKRLEGEYGVQAEELQLFVITNTAFPDVRLNDRLELEDGTQYLVITPPRRYARTMQIDTRIMQ